MLTGWLCSNLREGEIEISIEIQIPIFYPEKFNARNDSGVQSFNLRGDGLVRIYDFDCVLRNWEAGENDFFIFAKNFAYGNQWSLQNLPFLTKPE